MRGMHSRQNVSDKEQGTRSASKGTSRIRSRDLAGPIEPVAKDGFKSFVDDFLGTNMVYFLRQKRDAVEATEKFLADTASYGKVRRLRSDNGGEFMNYRFKYLLRKRGIKHETSASYSPHQNGTIERTWRTLFNMARYLLLEAKLPKNLWTYTVMTSVYIRNRCFSPPRKNTLRSIGR